MIEKKKLRLFDVVNVVLLLVITMIILYPLYFTFIASFSEPYDVIEGNVKLWIKGFTIDSYEQVFRNKDIWMGYKNSLIYTVAGTVFSLFLTIPAAYALSKASLWKKGIIITYFVITMYFSGGLLPTYLLVRDIGLLDKSYTLIILGSFSVYNMVVARTYFQTSIPDTLYEAASIEGCSQFGQFFYIGIPLAKPIIAVISLYYAVGRWNDFYNCLVYVNSKKYDSLQMILRNILLESQTALASVNSKLMTAEQIAYHVRRAYLAEAMKYSVIIIASLPMLIMYPFVQKYFVKGVMIGSVKG